MLKRDSPGRLVEPEYCDLRGRVLTRIASGQLTEDSYLSKVLDSLELVELTMEVEESGVEPAVGQEREGFADSECLWESACSSAESVA